MLKKIVLSFSVALILISAQSQIKWPAITQTNKPWTRWWWEGSAVNKKDLSWNLEQYQQAGLGGVEVTPIYGVYGYEQQFINFLSPQWMEMFDHTLAEAKRLGLGVDLANGTGWPFGGPWVTDDDASKTIYFKTYSLKNGESLQEYIVYDQPTWIRTANNKAAGIDSILKPVSLNKNLQLLALDQIQYPEKLPLKLLMAYADGKPPVNITAKVVDGKLNWTAPAGEWTLYALFEGLHGKMVERAAPGGEGYAIDHFSAASVSNYFKKFDNAFKGHDISYLRSFFNDSYEVDDAKGQSNWTPLLFEEFKKRKGYDLKENLPALFGKDDAEKNSRVIYDYRSVIDELLLEHFTIGWKKWAGSRGKMVRNQSHGSPANTLDLYSVVDIPETEGDNILRFKFATSAANVTGKKLVSSESTTWLNEHFLSSWGDVKKAIDLYFLGGVNHIFYHGSEYSPKDAPWPGWLFYAAVHYQPTNPQWKDFSTLNNYIARVQSFLQNGKPDNDILLYYPIVDRYSEPGKLLLQHFDGMEKNFEKTDFEEVSKWMLEKGYSFDFFSDRQLLNFKNGGTKISSAGNFYQTILLPANKFIPEQSFKKLIDLAKAGGQILIYKNLPADVPGYGRLPERRSLYNQLTSQLHFKQKDKIQEAVIGKGKFLMSDDLEALLQRAKARKEDLAEKGFSALRRKNAEGAVYFITNRSDKPIAEWVNMNASVNSVALFNPMTTSNGLGRLKKDSRSGLVQVFVSLQPFESIILQTYSVKKTGQNYPYLKAAGNPTEIKGEWSIEFLEGGPTLPSRITAHDLIPWTGFDGEDVANFSGTAKYTISFERPADQTTNWILDLGKVNETAEVFLNGKKVSTLIGPVFQLMIPNSLLQQTNKLEIIVANLMANRIAYMDKKNIPWKIFYNTNMPARKRENSKNGLFSAADWKPLTSGLSGPVTLTPANENE